MLNFSHINATEVKMFSFTMRILSMSYLDNIIKPLEHSTSYWALALVVQPVRVGPVLDEELDQIRMAIVRR